MIFLVVAMAVLPFIRNVKKRHYNENILQRFTWSGYLIILFSTALIILSISQYQDTIYSKAAGNLKTVTTPAKDNSAVPAKLNFNSATASDIKNPPVNTITPGTEKPLLEVEENPNYVKDGDSTAIALNIKNYSRGDARNIDAKEFILESARDTFKILKTFDPLEEREFLAEHQTYLYLINDNFHNNKQDTLHNFYVYFKVNYTDENGIEQSPLRKIYPIPYPRPGVYIQNLKDIDFYRVESFLVKDKDW